MAFVPTPGIVMVTVFYQSNDATDAINRFYVAASEVPTADEVEEAANIAYDAFSANIVEIMSDQWNLTGITARAMNEEEGLQFVHAGPFPLTGVITSALQTPNQATYTVTLNTGLVGRSARGRLYGVGLPPDAHDGARLLGTSQSLFQAKWNLVQSAFETGGHALQVVSFVEGGVARAEGRPLPCLSVTVRFPLATQRRRLS